MNEGLLHEWWQQLPTLLGGLGTSLLLTLISLTAGIPLAVGLALWSSAPSRAVRYLGIALVEAGRGTPALVLLQIAYFGLPQVDITLESFTAAAAGLAIVAGAYMSEIIRAGLDAVPIGQREAARAAGLTRRDELWWVVLPQAFRIAIPPLLGFSIVMFQATSLAFSVSVSELLSKAYRLGSERFVFLEALTLAGLIYAAIVIPASAGVRRLERRMNVM